MSTTGAIVGVGMATPLGLDARQSSLVLRARKLAPGKNPYQDRRGFSLGDVRSKRLDDACVGRERMLSLAAPALAEAEAPLGADFFAELGKRAGVPLAPEACEPFVLGHAGFSAALARALAFVAQAPRDAARGRPCAIVGGIDSHHDPVVLAALDKERRVHGDGVWDGFIPSEAAAFVVVAPAGSTPALARVLAVTTGMEREDTGEGPNPPIGEAATEVVRAAAAALRAPVPWVLPDVNGERHRVKEWSFVRIRNPERFDDHTTVETRLCDELGDVGAASGAVHAAYACMAFRMGFAPAPEVLVALASEGPARGAFALGAP